MKIFSNKLAPNSPRHNFWHWFVFLNCVILALIYTSYNVKMFITDLEGAISITISHANAGVVAGQVTYGNTTIVLTGKEWYVAPNGSSSGDGSLGNPWNIDTMLNAPAVVKPGDVIRLRGGNYSSTPRDYVSKLAGTASSPV